MIAGGPAMGTAGHEAVTPELAPRGNRLGLPGDRWLLDDNASSRR